MKKLLLLLLIPIISFAQTKWDTGKPNSVRIEHEDRGGSARLDEATHALMTVTYEHHEIHSGSHYYIKNHQSFANAEVLDFTITTPNTGKWSHFLLDLSAQGEFSLETYEGATVDVVGTAVASFNSNRNSSNTTVNTIRVGDTFTDTGTLIASFHTGANRVGGSINRGDEIILKQNTVYIFRITNETALANTISWNVNWYEHTARSFE